MLVWPSAHLYQQGQCCERWLFEPIGACLFACPGAWLLIRRVSFCVASVLVPGMTSVWLLALWTSCPFTP